MPQLLDYHMLCSFLHQVYGVGILHELFPVHYCQTPFLMSKKLIPQIWQPKDAAGRLNKLPSLILSSGPSNPVILYDFAQQTVLALRQALNSQCWDFFPEYLKISIQGIWSHQLLWWIHRDTEFEYVVYWFLFCWTRRFLDSWSININLKTETRKKYWSANFINIFSYIKPQIQPGLYQTWRF